MNPNYFKEYELTYKAYVVLPANISITYNTTQNLSDLLTKEIERVNKCIVVSTGKQLKETNNEVHNSN